MHIRNTINLQTIQGESISVGTTMITPFSRRLCFGLPEWLSTSKGFAVVIQQPVKVRVEEAGQTVNIRICDWHKIIILTLLLITAASLIITHHVGLQENR
jgi:hypothetical protein